MRIFAVGTKILGGGWQTFGGSVPPGAQRRTAPARLTVVYKAFNNLSAISLDHLSVSSRHTRVGALKMREWKMQEWKMRE